MQVFNYLKGISTLGLLSLLVACSSADRDTRVKTYLGEDADAGIVADTSVGFPDAMTMPDVGMEMPDAGMVPKVCENLGAIPQPFKTPSTSYNFGDIAGDFSVNAYYEGEWNLRDHWTGCESYVFVNYIPVQGSSDDQFWASVAEVLVDETPVNSHFFFISWEATEEQRLDRVQTILAYVGSYIEIKFGDADERAAQLARFHYVTDSPSQIRGSVKAFLDDYMAFQRDAANRVDLGNRGMASPPLPTVFGIDRDQKWDSGGNMNEHVGGVPAFRMASYLPHFYNHKAGIRDKQQKETGVDTHVLLEDRVTSRIFVKTATLPAAQMMAGYDTLEFDVTVNCPYRNVFACSEWDRIARIEVCTSTTANPCAQRRELVRWITPYWRRGERRWVMDASPLMGYVKDGGLQYFRIEMGPGWERATARDVRVSLRLSNSASGMRAVGVERTFSGGGFSASYNDREPMRFTPPAGAKKVELIVILSGHGQVEGNNCAEWCDHRHQFAVNGQNLKEIRHEGQIGSVGGCGWAAAKGASPGQYGNWAPERAYWCPGLPVDHKVFDLTSMVNLGQENQLTYGANYRGGTPAGGSISLSTYVVWYE